MSNNMHSSNKDENEDIMYTIKDIEEIFKISHNTAYKLVNSRNFPKIKINRRFYIPKRKLKNWIDRNMYKEIDI